MDKQHGRMVRRLVGQSVVLIETAPISPSLEAKPRYILFDPIAFFCFWPAGGGGRVPFYGMTDFRCHKEK